MNNFFNDSVTNTARRIQLVGKLYHLHTAQEIPQSFRRVAG
jgi:hypothetical protein